MTWIVTAVVALALLGAILANTRGFVRQAAQSVPFCRVHLASDDGSDITTAEVTLVGTPRTFALTRLTCEARPQSCEGLAIQGFTPETDHGLGEGVASWRPDAPIKVAPGIPLILRIGCHPNMARTIRLTGWLETRVGAGGSATFFHVLAGPLAREQRELRNLESRVRSESIQQGIRPIEHPEWVDVLRLREREEQAPNP